MLARRRATFAGHSRFAKELVMRREGHVAGTETLHQFTWLVLYGPVNTGLNQGGVVTTSKQGLYCFSGINGNIAGFWYDAIVQST